MTQNMNNQEYLNCSGCGKKFINDDDHIKNDFGYDRLNVRYKSCIQCRSRYAKHRETHREERRESAKQYYTDNKDNILIKKNEYRNNNKDTINEKIKCNVCDSLVSRHGIARHHKTTKCKKAISIDN